MVVVVMVHLSSSWHCWWPMAVVGDGGGGDVVT